jgi:2-polyprenyl-3-methyl-5-hydroxy-6-metoxy-1,4-benzoquinol methylase
VNEKTTCPLCASRELLLITNKVRFGNNANVYNCAKCDQTFLDQKSFNFPKDFYEKDYHQTYITHVEPDALNPAVYYEKMKKASKIWADKFRGMLTGKEVVLDLGCSTGHFIDLVKDRTKEIYGHDLSKKEVEFCKEVLKLDVSDQPLNERFKEGTFDYITMIYVLEHIAEPREFLSSVKKLLKPNGKLVILVPNAQDALVNFYSIPEFRSFYYCIEHVYYYTPKTIKELFDVVGLKGEIEVIQEYPITNHLNWAYKKAPSNTLDSRRGVPDVPLRDERLMEDWIHLWEGFNKQYQAFLKEKGFGDRVWCVVGKE